MLRLDLSRHKGIIASTVVTMFCFATFFLLVSVIMIVAHFASGKPENTVAARMGLDPINIAVTLMAMGVGCSTISMSLAYAIEDINWG